MPQPLEVMAFRKRLKSAGYTEIRIVWDAFESRCSGMDVYGVSAVEPLAGQRVFTLMTLERMYHAFQRERGGILTKGYSALKKS